MRSHSFGKGNTDVDDKQRTGGPNTSTADDKVYNAHALCKEDRRFDIARCGDTSIGSEYSTVNVQLDYRILWHLCVTER